jgi:alpha-glucosidase
MAGVLTEKEYRHRQPFMVTEAYPDRHNPLAAYMNFYAGMNPKVAAPFNFEGVDLPWEANAWRRFLKSFHAALEQLGPACIPSYAFGNHDKPRLAGRLGEAAARSTALMLMTLPGMIFIYYGEELGMKNVTIPAKQIKDPAAKGKQGRDPGRTPMQWSAAKNAGFTTAGEPWLPVASDYKLRNVEKERADPTSFFNLYLRLTDLRNHAAALKTGDITLHEADFDQILSYERTAGDTRYITVINFSNEAVSCLAPVPLGKPVISSDPSSRLTSAPGGVITLRAHEAVLFEATRPAPA